MLNLSLWDNYKLFLWKRHPNCNKETLLPQLTEEMTNSSTGEKAPDEPEAPRHEEVSRRNSPVVGISVDAGALKELLIGKAGGI